MSHVTYSSIKLTKTQEKHFEAIKWLLTENYRAEGRSYLMSYIFIEEALEYPGRSIRIFDHYPTEESKGHLMTRLFLLVTQKQEQGTFAPMIRKIPKQSL